MANRLFSEPVLNALTQYTVKRVPKQGSERKLKKTGQYRGRAEALRDAYGNQEEEKDRTWITDPNKLTSAYAQHMGLQPEYDSEGNIRQWNFPENGDYSNISTPQEFLNNNKWYRLENNNNKAQFLKNITNLLITNQSAIETAKNNKSYADFLDKASSDIIGQIEGVKQEGPLGWGGHGLQDVQKQIINTGASLKESSDDEDLQLLGQNMANRASGLSEDSSDNQDETSGNEGLSYESKVNEIMGVLNPQFGDNEEAYNKVRNQLLQTQDSETGETTIRGEDDQVRQDVEQAYNYLTAEGDVEEQNLENFTRAINVAVKDKFPETGFDPADVKKLKEEGNLYSLREKGRAGGQFFGEQQEKDQQASSKKRLKESQKMLRNIPDTSQGYGQPQGTGPTSMQEGQTAGAGTSVPGKTMVIAEGGTAYASDRNRPGEFQDQTMNKLMKAVPKSKRNELWQEAQSGPGGRAKDRANYQKNIKNYVQNQYYGDNRDKDYWNEQMQNWQKKQREISGKLKGFKEQENRGRSDIQTMNKLQDRYKSLQQRMQRAKAGKWLHQQENVGPDKVDVPDRSPRSTGIYTTQNGKAQEWHPDNRKTASENTQILNKLRKLGQSDPELSAAWNRNESSNNPGTDSRWAWNNSRNTPAQPSGYGYNKALSGGPVTPGSFRDVFRSRINSAGRLTPRSGGSDPSTVSGTSGFNLTSSSVTPHNRRNRQMDTETGETIADGNSPSNREFSFEGPTSEEVAGTESSWKNSQVMKGLQSRYTTDPSSQEVGSTVEPSDEFRKQQNKLTQQIEQSEQKISSMQDKRDRPDRYTKGKLIS